MNPIAALRHSWLLRASPPPPPAESPPRPAPAPYSAAALFRRLENGAHALTGKTGDVWDIAEAPQWRSKSKLLDPVAIQANNVVGSLAFALNILHNAGGRVICDIPAVIDQQLKSTVGLDSNELSVLWRSVTPGNPFDELPFYLLARASQISRWGKGQLFRERLVLTAQRMEHIQQNHGWVALQVKKSMFFPGTDVEALIRKAEGFPKIPQKGGKFAQVVTEKHFIGIDRQTGMPTKTYTVISDPASDVKTAHPGLPDPHYALPSNGSATSRAFPGNVGGIPPPGRRSRPE